MIKKDGNTIIIDTFRDLESPSAEFNKTKDETVKLIVKSAEHDRKVTDIVDVLKELKDLEWVEIQNPDTELCSIDGMLYSRDGKNLYFCARTGTVDIPDGTITICENAACNCMLSELIIPDSVKHINNLAFFKSYMLKEVRGGSGITDIGDYAFSTCVRLKKFNIGKNMKHIGDWAFANTCLTEISLPDGLKSVGDGAFRTFTIRVDENGFDYSIKLEPEDMYEIHIPKSLKSIGCEAFASASRVYTDFFDKQLVLACQDATRHGAKYKTKFCLIKIGNHPEIILPKTAFRKVDWMTDRIYGFLHSKSDIPPTLAYPDSIDDSILNNESELSALMEYCRRYHDTASYARVYQHDVRAKQAKACYAERAVSPPVDDADVERLIARSVRKILQIGVNDVETLIDYINAGIFNNETLKQMLDMADEMFGPDAAILKGYILNKIQKSEILKFTL